MLLATSTKHKASVKGETQKHLEKQCKPKELDLCWPKVKETAKK